MREDEVYAAIGQDGFRRLIAAFYRQIPADEVLGPMYRGVALAAAEKRLCDFLIYRFGGPQDYLEERGHPRLRMRHAPFAVNQQAREHWLAMMTQALRESQITGEARNVLWAYFEATAEAMLNRS